MSRHYGRWIPCRGGGWSCPSEEQPSAGRTTRLRVGITLYGWCLLSTQPGETGLWGRR